MKDLTNHISNYKNIKYGSSKIGLLITSIKQIFKRGYVVITGVKRNHVRISRLSSKSKIRIAFRKGASNNKIIIDEDFSGVIDVKVVGDNNEIYIGKNTILDNVNIELLNCNSLIAIGSGVSMGEGRINLSEGSGQYSSIYSGKSPVSEINRPSESGLSIIVGDDCLISSGVTMMSSDGHPILNMQSEKISSSGNILIGKHVWIGTDVKVLKDTIIGNGSVIGIGSIVTKNIPQNTIAVGNPCKPIKHDFGFWARSVSEKNINQAQKVLLGN